jgi:hypothetical protein|mmetsp:Transcript_4317/g.6633  ORF Transcript_4317/g.6633 Transcript_4317/m.6633 type:complete len:140 (-) Transcript_4317:569-988(-)
MEPLVTAVLLTNLLQYCYHKAVATRSGSHWEKFGPVYLVALAALMQMMMPLAVLFIYVGEVGYPDSKMWKDGSWFPNTPHGVLLYLLKWIGMVCLVIGVLQITRLHIKIRDRWREIRGIVTPLDVESGDKTLPNVAAAG